MRRLQDFEILEELLDCVEQLQQRCGSNPKRKSASSAQVLRKDLAVFRAQARTGKIAGRARKRKSGEIFRRIVSLAPEIWT